MQCDSEFLYKDGNRLFCMLEKGHDGLHENTSAAGGRDYKIVWGIMTDPTKKANNDAALKAKTRTSFVPRNHCLAISVMCVMVSVWLVLLMGCATNAIKPDCSDDSIVAATIWHLRTGDKTYIQKSVAGDHAQAYAVINGRNVPLRVFPAFSWYVLPGVEDDMTNGKGETYTVYDFIQVHAFKGK